MSSDVAEKENNQTPMEPRHGIVSAKDWITAPDQRTYLAFEGNMRVVEDKQLVGFRVSGHVSDNWCVEVCGHTETIYILGCQVKALSFFPIRPNESYMGSPNVYVVK